MILDDILTRTRADLEARMKARPLKDLDVAISRIKRGPRSLADALRRPGEITCIAEFKRRSPSAGWINEKASLTDTVSAYAAGGARALSVLTDGPFFGGALADLELAHASCKLPVLRKDFIVDVYQIAEARAAGADAVLLIVAALDGGTLGRLLTFARALKVDVLVEAHDEAEVARAVAAGADIIGINNRDLRTLKTDLATTEELAPLVPPDRFLIAESGIRTHADLGRLAAVGPRCFLVGESLAGGTFLQSRG